MTIYLSNRDGNGKTSEEGHYKFQTAVFSGSALGPNGLLVRPNSPLGLSVIVSPGQYKIDTSSDYSYTGWLSSDEVVAISTADPANPRITSIVLYVDRLEDTSPTPPNNPGVTKLIAVNGAPGAVPSAPTSAAIQTAVGPGNPYIILATVRLEAAATQVVSASITDTRSLVTLGSSLVSENSLAESAVSTAKLANLAVTSDKLAANAVTTAKVLDGAVTDAKWRNDIAFYARRVAARTFAATTFVKLACDNISLNRGGGYSNTSDIGRFTAPVAGFYYFGASLNAPNSSNTIISFYKNGSNVESRAIWVQSTNNQTSAGRALFLNAGDFVEPYGYVGTATNIASQATNTAHITDFFGWIITRT